ncbi:MAG: apolipoprotein N-acyltransferase, partial [Litorimonas sp.]
AAGLGLAWATRRWGPGLLTVSVLAGLFGGGTLRLSGAHVQTQPGIVLRLVAVPFSQSEKIDPRTSVDIVNAYLTEGLGPGLADVTHLVWPEGAVNGLAIEDEPLLRAMGSLLVQVDDTPPVWLMNSLRMEIAPNRRGEPRRRFYNSAVAVEFDALGNPAVAATNDKRKLVPFGEFIPGGEPVERLGARLVSTALGSITPAPEKRIALFPGLPPISPQICYEVIFPGLTPAGDARTGPPQAILNQSNDAWFGATLGPDQHAAIARYRAIEEGLPLIRSAANGISGVFDSFGRAERVLDGKSTAHLDALLPLPVGKSVSMRRINAYLLLFVLALTAITSLGFRRG